MKGVWKILLGLAAVGLFGWYLSGLGLANVWSDVKKIGPFAPLLLVPYFVVYLVDCTAWARTLPPRCLPFLSLLRIRWAGESVNHLVPSAYVGGEGVKIHMLHQRGVSGTQGAMSAVISKTAQTLAQFFFIIIASVIFLFLAVDSGVRLGILLVVVSGVAAIAFLFWCQKFGVFRMVTTILNFLPFKIGPLERRKSKLLDLDRTISHFYRDQPGRFSAATLLYFFGWMLDTVEIMIVSHLLGMPITWTQAVVVEAFAGVAKIVGMWIPGSVGVQESGIVLIGSLAGLPNSLSAAYALIRRARELVFAGVGLLFLYGKPLPRQVEAAPSSNVSMR